MSSKYIFVAALLLSLVSMVWLRVNPVGGEVSGSNRVHNLNTGLAYTSIQEAIDANETLDGHTIFVDAGTYYEHVVVNKSLTLMGESKNSTIVDGNGTESVFSLTVQNVSLSNFTVVNAGFQSPISGAILVNQTTHCMIENVKALDSEPCGIVLFNSTHNEISGCEASNNEYDGILLVNSDENTIINNTVSENGEIGIGLGGPNGSNNNLLADNQISSNAFHGVDIVGLNNSVSSNQIWNNLNGVLLDMANCSLVDDNDISNNTEYGAYLIRGSENNTVVENRIQHNYCGICIRQDSGNHNRFYHNNIIKNTAQVLASASQSNAWDNGQEGNFWSDYAGPDLNHDGLGDDWYSFNENNTDHYPLMGIFSSFGTSLGCDVDVVSNSTTTDFEYFESNRTIRMRVFNATADQTIGFCRICIPKTLIDVNNLIVIIDNGLVPASYENLTLFDNGTHRWIYFAYPLSMHRIAIVPEFPSYLLSSIFMFATLLATAVCKRKQSNSKS